MQPPVKKKVRRRLPLPLLCAIAALLVCASFLLYRYAGQRKQQALEETLLPGAEDLTLWNNSDVLSFTVTPRGSESYTLCVGEDGLLSSPDGTMTVQESIGEGMLSALRYMKAQQVVAEEKSSLSAEWEAMGLTDPAVTVSVLRSNGETFSFSVGNRAEEGYYFVTDTDPRLLLVARDAYSTFCLRKEELLTVTQPVMIPTLMDRVTLADSHGSLLWEMGVCGGNYTLLSPYVLPVDGDEGEGILTLVSSLLLGSPCGEDTPENRLANGMDDSALTLRVHQRTGTESGRTATEETLVFDLMPPSEEALQTCVAYQGQLYRSLTYILSPVLTEDYRAFLSRTPLAVNADGLQEILCTRDGKTTVYDPGTQDLTDFLAALSAVQITGSLQGNESCEAEPVWTVSATLTDGTVRTVSACRMDALNWALSVGGVPMYYLSSRTLLPF